MRAHACCCFLCAHHSHLPLSLNVPSRFCAFLTHAYICRWRERSGQGDNDIEYDTLLVLPVLITSGIIIFNWRGAPQKSFMLDLLGTLAKAASKLELGEGEGAADRPTKRARTGAYRL